MSEHDEEGIVADQSETTAGHRADTIGRLYADSFHDLCRWLAKIYGGGPPEPEDVAQEAFAKLSSLESLDHVENPKAFLFKVALNLSRRGIRRVVRNNALIAEILQIQPDQVEELSPERLLGEKERVREVGRRAAALSDKQRTVLYRSRVLGETYAEISQATGWSSADISRQMTAAIKALKEADPGEITSWSVQPSQE